MRLLLGVLVTLSLVVVGCSPTSTTKKLTTVKSTSSGTGGTKTEEKMKTEEKGKTEEKTKTEEKKPEEKKTEEKKEEKKTEEKKEEKKE